MKGTSAKEIVEVAFRVAQVLEELGARYLVGGSVASSLLGEPRATNDIDFLVDLRESQVDQLAERLGPDFSVDQVALREAIRRRGSGNLFYLPLVTKVDLFFDASDPFHDSELQRRRRFFFEAESAELYVASPEDLILKKLAWYRSGNEVSDSQWRDVLGILAVSGERLDRGYLGEWAPRLRVADLLQRAFVEAASR